MQLYAMSTGSFRMGALVMLLFALGTLPGLLGVGSLTSIFKGKVAKIAYQAIGMLVILLGMYNIANSYGVIKATLAGASDTHQDCDETLGICSVGETTTSSSQVETLQMTYTKN
jgi:sulfite exporter TauE/SafE